MSRDLALGPEERRKLLIGGQGQEFSGRPAEIFLLQMHGEQQGLVDISPVLLAEQFALDLQSRNQPADRLNVPKNVVLLLAGHESVAPPGHGVDQRM